MDINQKLKLFRYLSLEQNTMETITQCEINLFADEIPSLEQITTLAEFVHSSERNKIDFDQQVEENLSKTTPSVVLGTGIGLFILGKDDDAIKKLKKAPDCKEKFIYLAFALRRSGQIKAAIENLDKSLQFEADSLTITLEKAATYRCAKNLEAASEELKSCANFENVSAEFHYQQARILQMQGEYIKAAKNYQTAIDLSPDHQKARFHLAYLCDISGDEEAALENYKQIISTSSAYVSALLNLSVIFEDMGDYDNASQCVENVLDAHPNHQRAILFKKDIDSSKTMYYDEEKEKKKSRKSQILETPISDFELSVRSRNCLRKMNIHTIGDLLNISEAELLSYKNFGETSLTEIKIILESKSLQLGMSLEEKQFPPAEHFENASEDVEQDKVLLGKTIDDLQLSVRARKCVEKLNMRTLAELTSVTEAELLGCKNFGVTSLNEIKKSLTNLGLSLRTLE